MTVPVLRTLSALRSATREWHLAGETIGVVPTMGALHDGHLSLVAAAKSACDRVIVTIFVNPKQFNKASDLASYPRTEEDDARKLARFDVDAVYAPDVSQIYPEGFCTNVSVAGMTDVLCGAHRPGHFDGVATVVTKLFTQTSADKAFFGEKDFQQLMVVQRMARDLDIPIEVVGCPTIREEDGLAMSSRNLLLSDRARTMAPRMHEIMQEAATALGQGAPFDALQATALRQLTAAGFTDVDYFELRSCASLSLLDHASVPARLFAAAWLAGVRLIDNIDVPVAR
ncbi:pantoate--beta-alanine ligase [Roseobacter denitrificans]|uniref:Pantothenate synthetase n=1 Tax=Roseobacter denitrificans (strain ATCC 33942 / OCh 114) TaxID=375451 RepID=PANC_ROSDO|nr:pantoate--beta-alanine ligase [Roseobacter denitrificans]Q16DW6.1 RecName: Full=Pantothenate synthetase; Short=PS; AltName: Full=Pantoate--beta-alanine ligase; AltName: Full=Pantoate-activating enzyme [Roseobacter denitrificans OCh 114]ABG29827.1 pantoate--beta-alanine ligase [Roseobacter denitrificans OCh 114]AVL53048.1 pantoate--beta-alanine ligase [Roseobacter denitrificans]SFG26311.1 pantothenate synthetase [Roseobacter denitrificans OCh 114]